MGAMHVHEFMSLDGVIDAPTSSFEYGFDPEMAERIGAVTGRCAGILLGRTTDADRRGRPGRGKLIRAMLADDLVDERHLFVYPLARGSGPRLFPEGALPRKLSLGAADAFNNGAVYVNYCPQAAGEDAQA
jgi:RibD C-terminal domain